MSTFQKDLDRVRAQKRAAIVAAILEERHRQIADLGHTPEHDDGHVDGSLAMAAALYAAPEQLFIQRRLVVADAVHFMDPWPWERQADKRRRRHTGGFVPKEELAHDIRRKQLVQAAALIVAEIERIDRAADRGTPPAPPRPRTPANEGAAVLPGSDFGTREG